MARFEKGHKGGPGRPKGGHIEWCREFADKQGKKILLDLASSKNPKVQIQAITLIFAYGHGKPHESADVNLNGQITLTEAIKEARARRRA